jgi:hypothetical protein
MSTARDDHPSPSPNPSPSPVFDFHNSQRAVRFRSIGVSGAGPSASDDSLLPSSLGARVVPETLRVAVDDVDKGVDKGVDRSVDEKHQNSDSSALLSMPLSTKSTLPPTRPGFLATLRNDKPAAGVVSTPAVRGRAVLRLQRRRPGPIMPDFPLSLDRRDAS